MHRNRSKRYLAATGMLGKSTHITKTHLPFWTFDTVVYVKYKGASRPLQSTSSAFLGAYSGG